MEAGRRDRGDPRVGSGHGPVRSRTAYRARRGSNRSTIVRGRGRRLSGMLFSGGRWPEGPVYVPAGVPAVQRHPERPDHALGRDRRLGQRLPLPRRVHQRPHPRPPRAPRVVLARVARVTRTELDGSITVWLDDEGKRPNSPNDVVDRADGRSGSPTRVRHQQRLRGNPEPEIDGCHVYRVDPSGGGAGRRRLRAAQRARLQLRRSQLYIADSRPAHPPLRCRRRQTQRRRRLRRVPAGASTVCAWTSRAASGPPRDGLTASTPTAPIWDAPDPPAVSNLVFGGPKRNRLFITATTTLYTLRLKVTGAHTYPPPCDVGI